MKPTDMINAHLEAGLDSLDTLGQLSDQIAQALAAGADPAPLLNALELERHYVKFSLLIARRQLGHQENKEKTA